MGFSLLGDWRFCQQVDSSYTCKQIFGRVAVSLFRLEEQSSAMMLLTMR